MTHGLDTSFLLAVEIVEHAHRTDALRLLAELLARGDRIRGMRITVQDVFEYLAGGMTEDQILEDFS